MGLSFKEQMAEDLDKVFFNPDEFGEEHRVEGKKILIIIDDDQLIERKSGIDANIAEASLLFYAKEKDLPHRQIPNTTLNVDGMEYIVCDWSVSDGMVQVTLSQNRV